MKTIGLIGGMSWESTASYYAFINQQVKAELGGLHSAKVCLYSVNFAEIEVLQHANKWHEASVILIDAAKRLEAAGADFIVICTNTMHKLYSEIQAETQLPIIHIADATAEQLKKDGIEKVGLLGTRFTMEEDFYKSRLQSLYGIEVLIPNEEDRQSVHRIIYDELCLGKVENGSRETYINIINRLYEQGVQAVILGCTEIALLIQQEHTPVRLYDTTMIHAESAVKLALK